MREKQHQRGLSSSYLEPDRYDDEEEGEEAISLAAIKSKYKGGGGLRGNCANYYYFFFNSVPLGCVCNIPSVLIPEERARIYSSDSDEGSDDDKAQRLMKAKKLDSDEVGAELRLSDRGRCEVGHWMVKRPLLPFILI